MIKRPVIKSNYQFIRLWFEFYKLALKDKSLKDNIKKSNDYYKSWGKVDNKQFDSWFKEKGHLFALTKIKEIKDKPKNLEATIHLSIPINQPVTTILKELKDIILQKQKTVTPVTYEFTKDKTKIKGSSLYDIQLIYTLYIDWKKPPINHEFITKVIKWFRSRNRSQWVPLVLQTYESDNNIVNKYTKYTDNYIRQIRRYIKQGEAIINSVSLGKFPGNTSLK